MHLDVFLAVAAVGGDGARFSAGTGDDPLWSLLLNPTPSLLAELGYPSAESLRRAVRAQERITRELHRGRDLDTPGHEPEL